MELYSIFRIKHQKKNERKRINEDYENKTKLYKLQLHDYNLLDESLKQEITPPIKPEKKTEVKPISNTILIIIILFGSLLISTFSFFLTRFRYKSDILRYKSIFEFYEKQGITGQDAVDRIELEKRSRRRDAAIAYSGSRYNSGYNSRGGINFNF